MPRYITITRGDTEYKRRVLNKAEKAARLAKFRATMAATMAKRHANGSNGNGHAHTHAEAQTATPKTNGTVQPHGTDHAAEYAAHRRQTEEALIHLKRGADWLQKHWGTTLRELDPAHVELINARAALLRK